MVRSFRRRGYAVFRGFFTEAQIAELAEAVLLDYQTAQDRERCGVVRNRVSFIRAEQFWLRSTVARRFTFDQRLAALVCDLLGVDALRLISDDVFFKPSSARVSSWHFDRDFVPIDRDHFASIWIPLTPTTRRSGAMAYAAGSHTRPLARPRGLLKHEVLSHVWYQAQTRLRGVSVDTIEASVGDILIHHGCTFHMAHPNLAADARVAFGIHVVDARSKFVTPANVEQQRHVDTSGWSAMREGDEIESPRSPIIYQRPS